MPLIGATQAVGVFLFGSSPISVSRVGINAYAIEMETRMNAAHLDRRLQPSSDSIAWAFMPTIGKALYPHIREKILLFFLTIVTPASWSCEDMTVRDAAFTEARDMHRLCVMASSSDLVAARTEKQLADWLIGSGSGLNLEVVRVDADNPDVKWEDFGIPSSPPTLPVVVLAGKDVQERRTFFVDYWDPVPNAEDLSRLESSPVREAIRSELGKRLAVFLYSPGTGSEEGKAATVIEEVEKDWSKKEKLGVATVRLNRRDPAERTLVSFLGLPEEGPDWLAVLFGPGKITPPLQGDEITARVLNEKLEQLTTECGCLQVASNFGVDIPIKWGDTDSAAVVPLREYDGISEPVPAVPTLDLAAIRSTLFTLGGLIFLVLFSMFILFWKRGSNTY